MKIYWTLRSVPELASLPKPERNRVWKSCYHKAFRHWQAWLALALCGICGAAGGPVGKVFFGDSNLIFVCMVVGGGVGGFIFGQVATLMAIPYIRQELSRKDPDVTT